MATAGSLSDRRMHDGDRSRLATHTAVAIGVANKISTKENTIILSTAHASKFSEAVTKATNKKPELPENFKDILLIEEKYKKLPKDLKEIQNYILQKV